jgi:hypothetical protein
MSKNVMPPKHELLQKFAVILMNFNPMNLVKNDSYENEALSILSRFTETGLQIPDESEEVVSVAVSIVKQSFEFWFYSADDVDCEPIARALYHAFNSSHETSEEKHGIKSVTIG